LLPPTLTQCYSPISKLSKVARVAQLGNLLSLVKLLSEEVVLGLGLEKEEAEGVVVDKMAR